MKREEHLHLDIQISKSKETIYLQKTGHFQKKYQHQHQFLLCKSSYKNCNFFFVSYHHLKSQKM